MNFLVNEEWVDEVAYGDLLPGASELAAAKIADAKAVAAEAGVEPHLPLVKHSATAQSELKARIVADARAEVQTSRSMRQLAETSGELAAEAVVARRPSFVSRVAKSVGFDWDLLEEVLSKRHVIMFLFFVFLCTLGVALTNFALTAWVHDSKGLPIDDVGVVMAVMSIGCFLVSLPTGYIFDMLPSKRTTCIVAAAMTAIANLALVWCVAAARVGNRAFRASLDAQAELPRRTYMPRIPCLTRALQV